MTQKTTLYLFCGAPASGKTTISKRLSKELDVKRLSFYGCALRRMS